MKKIFLFILVVTLCWALCACGGAEGGSSDATETDKSANSMPDGLNLQGEWLRVTDGLTIVFNEGGKCIFNGQECKYKYDAENQIVSVTAAVTTNFNVVKKDDTYILTLSEHTFVPADFYEKYHGEFAAEALKTLVEGKTELVVGESYTTKNGTSFKFDKAELLVAEPDNGNERRQFSLTFTYTTNIPESGPYTVRYKSPRKEAGFSLTDQERDGNPVVYLGMMLFSAEELKAAKNDYGILSFELEDTAYYVPVAAFVDQK